MADQIALGVAAVFWAPVFASLCYPVKKVDLTITNYQAVWVSMNASSGTFSPCRG